MSAGLAVAKAQDVPGRAEPEAMSLDDGAPVQEDLYTKLKTLQRQLEFLEIQVRGLEATCVVAERGEFRPARSPAQGAAHRLESGCEPPSAPAPGLAVAVAGGNSPPDAVALAFLCLLLLSAQEDYIKEEQKNLKNELLRAQEEVKRIQARIYRPAPNHRRIAAAPPPDLSLTLCPRPLFVVQAVPLVIGQFLEMVDNNTGIVGSTTGSNYYVRILSTLNRYGLHWPWRFQPGPPALLAGVSLCVCAHPLGFS